MGRSLHSLKGKPMNTPSAKDLLQAMPVKMAEGGEISSGLANATKPDGIGADQYYKNIAAYVATQSDPLIGLQEASKNGVSMADAAKAIGQDKLNAYLNIDLNTEKTPTPTASGYTSARENMYVGPNAIYATGPDSGQAGLNAKIQAAAKQYVGNPTALQNLFIANGLNIDDIVRAGVDPTVMLSITPKKVDKPPTTGVFPPVTLPPVYQPLPTPPPLYPTGQPALDVNFRNSAPRSAWDPVYGYSYTPAAKLLSATGSGFGWMPPSVTSRPRDLLRTPMANTSASQQYAQNSAAQDRALANAYRTSGLGANPSAFYDWRSRLRGGEFGGDQTTPLNTDAFNASFTDWAKTEADKQAIAKANKGTLANTSSSDFVPQYATGGYITKKAEGGSIDTAPVKPAPDAVTLAPNSNVEPESKPVDSTKQYKDVFQDEPLVDRVGEYLGGFKDLVKYRLSDGKGLDQHITYNNQLKSQFREAYPELKDDKQRSGLLDAAVKYAGAYDWAARPNVSPEDARSMARAYQLYDYNTSDRTPSNELSDYYRNLAGVEQGIKHRAEGRRLSESELMKEALNYAISQTGGNMPLTRPELWNREYEKGMKTKKADGGLIRKYDEGGDVSPMSYDELAAQMQRVGEAPREAQTPESRTTVREQTESAKMLERVQ